MFPRYIFLILHRANFIRAAMSNNKSTYLLDLQTDLHPLLHPFLKDSNVLYIQRRTKRRVKRRRRRIRALKNCETRWWPKLAEPDLIVRRNFLELINFIHLLEPYTSKRWKRRGRKGREYEITRVERVPRLFFDFFLPVDGCSWTAQYP